MALLIWTTSSRKLVHRDEHIGWDSRTREKRLSWIVQNNRFLLLHQTRPANLARRILSLAIKALPTAWEARYGKCPLLKQKVVREIVQERGGIRLLDSDVAHHIVEATALALCQKRGAR